MICGGMSKLSDGCQFCLILCLQWIEKEDGLYKTFSQAQFSPFSYEICTMYAWDIYTDTPKKIRYPSWGIHILYLSILMLVFSNSYFFKNRLIFKKTHLSQKLLRQPPFFFSYLDSRQNFGYSGVILESSVGLK